MTVMQTSAVTAWMHPKASRTLRTGPVYSGKVTRLTWSKSFAYGLGVIFGWTVSSHCELDPVVLMMTYPIAQGIKQDCACMRWEFRWPVVLLFLPRDGLNV
jgi:hypothetical protein